MISSSDMHDAKVLVVEDHPIQRSVLARLVTRLGYAAESAATGSEALEKLQSGRFGILITDCNMPQMNGYELARRIRGLEASKGGDKAGGRRIPIIACTAGAPSDGAEACLAAGMDDFLAKPVALKELAAKLDRWLPIAQAAPADSTVLAVIAGGDAAAGRELLAVFRRVNDADAAQLRLAVEGHDAPKVTHASHRIKGASGTIGAIALAVVCERLERAGRAGDWPAIEAEMPAFHRELERLNSHCEAEQCKSAS